MTMTEQGPYQSRDVRRGMGKFLSGKMIQAVAGVVVLLMMVRLMEVGQYANYVTAVSLAIFVGTVSILGLDRVLSRYIPEGRIKATPAQLIRFINRVKLLRLVTVGGVALGVALAWPHLASRLQLPPTGLTLPLILSAVSHAFDQVQRLVLHSLMLQAALRNAITATWMSRILFLLAVAFTDTPLTAVLALWITLVSEVIGWLWMARATTKHYVVLGRNSSIDSTRDSSWPSDMRSMLLFGWHNYLMGQASFPSQARVQQLLVAAFFPPTVVAAFGFFRNLSEQLRSYLPLQLMKSLAEPVMFGRYAQTQDFSELNAMTNLLMKANILLVAPLTAWLCVAGEPAIALLTGGKFIGELWVLAVLVASLAVSTQLTLLVIVANATGISRRLPVATVTASASTVLLLWSQIPTIGIVGVVLSDVVFGSVAVLIMVFGMSRDGYRYEFHILILLRMVIFVVLVAGLAVTARTFLIYEDNFFWSLSTGVAILAVYGALNAVWSPFGTRERELLKKIFGQARQSR